MTRKWSRRHLHKPDIVDLTGFQPKAVTRPDKQKVAEAAAKAQFKSREAKAPIAVAIPTPPQAKAVRRRRTGRSAQLNLKCRPETIEQFYAIADANGWVLGEALRKPLTFSKPQNRRLNASRL